MPAEPKHAVSTSRKTISIVATLESLDGAGVTEVADELDMNKSTVHNHLSTLEAEELVVRDGEQYRLGLRFLKFGSHVRDRSRLYGVAEPELDRLAERSGEFVNLGVEEFGRCVYLACEKGDRAVDLNFYPGIRRPMHLTALGKAILAEYPTDRVDEIVSRHGLPAETPESISDRESLDAELAEIRKRGVAFDDEECISGLRCVAVPIQTNDGRPLGAIGVSAPTSRLDDDRFFDEVPDLVLSIANVIGLNITQA
jgi:DNA-binding IclR family transcriptional regulator